MGRSLTPLDPGKEMTVGMPQIARECDVGWRWSITWRGNRSTRMWSNSFNCHPYWNLGKMQQLGIRRHVCSNWPRLVSLYIS